MNTVQYCCVGNTVLACPPSGGSSSVTSRGIGCVEIVHRTTWANWNVNPRAAASGRITFKIHTSATSCGSTKRARIGCRHETSDKCVAASVSRRNIETPCKNEGTSSEQRCHPEEVSSIVSLQVGLRDNLLLSRCSESLSWLVATASRPLFWQIGDFVSPQQHDQCVVASREGATQC